MSVCFASTRLPGCFQITPAKTEDARGVFIKTFHLDDFIDAPFIVPFQEEYVTTSRRGVMRGLHFQVPPCHLDKLVLCVHGTVLDAVVDLRVGSPTYGNHFLREMRGDSGDMLFIPAGCAHGFYALTDTAILVYKVSKVYSPECDAGVHWASAGIDWPDKSPLVSDRDRCLPSLADFQSPFSYEPS